MCKWECFHKLFLKHSQAEWSALLPSPPRTERFRLAYVNHSTDQNPHSDSVIHCCQTLRSGQALDTPGGI